MSPERDEQLWAEIERKKKQTLAESMQNYIQTPYTGAPMGQQPMQPTMPMGQQPILNEAYLTENVKKIVNNHLVESFGPIVEEAIKSTILEMYAVERIKEVLNENKEIIQNIVYDTIRQLQAKSKANK
jgi:ABC-type oligopeptide transport system ATPase subunit